MPWDWEKKYPKPIVDNGPTKRVSLPRPWSSLLEGGGHRCATAAHHRRTLSALVSCRVDRRQSVPLLPLPPPASSKEILGTIVHACQPHAGPRLARAAAPTSAPPVLRAAHRSLSPMGMRGLGFADGRGSRALCFLAVRHDQRAFGGDRDAPEASDRLRQLGGADRCVHRAHQVYHGARDREPEGPRVAPRPPQGWSVNRSLGWPEYFGVDRKWFAYGAFWEGYRRG